MSPTNDSTPLIDGLLTKVIDNDPEEAKEWHRSLDALIADKGAKHMCYILLSMLAQARQKNVTIPTETTVPCINTIGVANEPYFPGDENAERTYRRWLRWNAAVMVTRAQRPGIGAGRHISSYASTTTLYEVDFNHFFRGRGHPGGGDHIFFQGHASPGNYARAFIEGRLNETDLDGFRQEESRPTGGRGLPSCPHPRRMEDFWEYPTVSMDLGPSEVIYQAWFDKYLQGAGIKDTSQQHTQVFLGDGEMDKPESRGMLQLAINQQLDSLTFVINCNLQRLDGPARGSGRIIQELEAFLKDVGWNVIKVIWGRGWDQFLAMDKNHILEHLMMETLDGDHQTFKANNGACIREHFFGRDPCTAELVKDWTNGEIWALQCGGNDYRKIYAAYRAATEHKGQPTAIPAHTVEGYLLGGHSADRNVTHQMKKLTLDDSKALHDRLHIPITDEQFEANLKVPPYCRPTADDLPLLYMLDWHRQLGGFIPERRDTGVELELPGDKTYDILKGDSGKQEVASTITFVRLLKELIKDKGIGRHIILIVPDESRTFGLESLFPTKKIFDTQGQNYTPADVNMMLPYWESASGQLMHTGINEAGSASLFQVAGTSHAAYGEPMIPVYIFYSVFGFQRTGDQFWAAGDRLARGFTIGVTAGRTTLTGEGTQYMDGHSPMIAATNNAVVSYDPAYTYEIRHIVRDTPERWYGLDSGRNRDVMYYLTVYNEPIHQPAEPDGTDVEGILRSIHRISTALDGEDLEVQLLVSGVGMPWIEEARRILAEDQDVRAATWSATSWNELRRQALEVEKANFLAPDGERQVPYLTQKLSEATSPFIVTSDYDHLVPDQVRAWVSGGYYTLGASGFGFSDTRATARCHYLIDAQSVVMRALQALVEQGRLDRSVLAQVVTHYDLTNVSAGTSGSQGGES